MATNGAGRRVANRYELTDELGLELVAVGDASPGAVRGHRSERYRLPGRGATTLYPSGWNACSNWRARSWELSHCSTGTMNSML